ncbi:hypothetical protein O181_059777 [Austropuccinia psidii MF-1]|uniref:Uncharacterized protein n=1 Tax=Austropuccinia psidii MF-1 TaxID=1389203 RepID=A0A9Q3HXR3_9BASI|nr:hypothetical protein [Austropuccinia psidii MF-1]
MHLPHTCLSHQYNLVQAFPDYWQTYLSWQIAHQLTLKPTPLIHLFHIAPQTLTMDLLFQVENLVQDIYKVDVQAESLVDMISLSNDSQTSDQYDPDEDDCMNAASVFFSDGNLLATAPSKTIKQQRIRSNVYQYFEVSVPINL